MQINQGCLFIVATPIGNKEDITLRALKTLNEVDYILAEDTRHSAQLLNFHHITRPLKSFHEHNERKITASIISDLHSGKQIALISDAGTPLINDPGYLLVNTSRNENIKVVPIPGASALITALSASGLAVDRFCFEGFLTVKSGARINQLKTYLNESRTLIFYESPHRIVASIADMLQVFGPQHPVCIARELTKRFETFQSGTLQSVYQNIIDDMDQQKGEMVVMVSGFKKDKLDNSLLPETEHILKTLLENLSLKLAVDLTVKITKEKKKHIYQKALELQKKDSS